MEGHCFASFVRTDCIRGGRGGEEGGGRESQGEGERLLDCHKQRRNGSSSPARI